MREYLTPKSASAICSKPYLEHAGAAPRRIRPCLGRAPSALCTVAAFEQSPILPAATTRSTLRSDSSLLARDSLLIRRWRVAGRGARAGRCAPPSPPLPQRPLCAV